MDRAVTRGRGRALALALALLVGGCGLDQLRPPTPFRRNAEPPPDRLWAGVTEVDITPPIGLGLFGHGPESRVSTGIALRLRCQVFVVTGPRDGGGSEAVALVPCELPAPSLYLQRAIAERVAWRHAPIPASRIALLATHTHFGPNHYFASDGYTGPFSARRTGLDQDVVKLLAERIGDGIADAYFARRKARIGWASTALYGIAQNRSVAAFLHNTTLPTALKGSIAAAPDHPEQRAVDPTLALMRLELWDPSHGYDPAGALVIYGVHPSVINNRNSLYTGDLFGYATRDARRRIAEQASKPGLAPSAGPVVGIANGIEGDVTSIRAADTHRESRRLGHKLGAAIAELWRTFDGPDAPALDTQGPLQAIYRELHWGGASLGCGTKLCMYPAQGTPAAGGGEDHPTSMRIFSDALPGVRAVDDEQPHPCGWPRHPLIGLDPAAEPGASYPDIAPIMLVRIGRGLIATAPAELTTVTGYRVREAIARHFPNELGPISVAGLANEYIGYIATRDEYMVQHYEGASTLYGPDSAEFLREQFSCLAGRMTRGEDWCATHADQPEPDTLGMVLYGATRNDVLPPLDPNVSPAPLRELSAVTAQISYEGERVYGASFDGPEPDHVRQWSDLEIHVRAGEQPVTDGLGEQMRLLFDDTVDRGRWRVQWIAPRPGSKWCQSALHFVLKSTRGEVQSNTFVVDCSLPTASEAWP